MESNESTRFAGGGRVSVTVSRKPMEVTEDLVVRVEGVDCVVAELVRVVRPRDTPGEFFRIFMEVLELLEECDRRLKLVVRGVRRSETCRFPLALAAPRSKVGVTACANNEG